jgi:6-phosphogluconolactonase
MRTSSLAYSWSVCALIGVLAGCNGGGGAVSPPTSAAGQVRKADAPMTSGNEFVYVVNDGAKTVSAYKINKATGALTKVSGSPFATGNIPYWAAVDPAANYLYVANQNDASSSSLGSISGYKINPNSGRLSKISGSPFNDPYGDPLNIAITPNGGFLYVDSPQRQYDNITAYSVDASTGALSVTSESPFSGVSEPEGMAIAPSGNFLYTSDTEYSESAGEISGFSINSGNGALTQISGSPFAGHATPQIMAVAPRGGFLYIPNEDGDNKSGGSVSVDSINISTGALSEIPGSPYSAAGYPAVAAVTPSGAYLYVTLNGYDEVAGFSIEPSSNALIPVPGSPFAAGTAPLGAAVDPSGQFLYVANNGSNNISAYQIATNGSLTALSGSPFATGSEPVGVVAVTPL